MSTKSKIKYYRLESKENNYLYYYAERDNMYKCCYSNVCNKFEPGGAMACINHGEWISSFSPWLDLKYSKEITEREFKYFIFMKVL